MLFLFMNSKCTRAILCIALVNPSKKLFPVIRVISTEPKCWGDYVNS